MRLPPAVAPLALGAAALAAAAAPPAPPRSRVEKVVEKLHSLAEKIDPNDEKSITEVATIASNNNAEIGKKLAEAMKLVGAANGVITQLLYLPARKLLNRQED